MHREVAGNQSRALELTRAIGPVTARLLTVEDLATAAQAIVDQVASALNAEIAFLASVDEPRARLNYLAATGLPAEAIEERRSLPMNAPILIARAARTRVVQEIDNLERIEDGDELALTRKLLSLGTRSVVALPLIARGQLVGVLAIGRTVPGPLPTVERRALEQVAAACALGLNHARALEQARTAQLETARRLEDLERQHRLLEVVLAQAPSGIVAFEARDGAVMFSNKVARELFGAPLASGTAIERMRQGDGSPFPPEQRPHSRALAGQEVLNLEVLIAREGGQTVPVSVNAAPVGGDGKIFGAVMVLRDASAEKELERLRSEFAAVIAHDLRNPIQVVLLQTHLLLEAGSGPELTVARKSIERIRGAALRLARMVSDLLDATRIDVARLVLDPRPLAVAEATSRLVDQIRPVLGNHPVSVEVTGEVGPALLDPARFDQILANLLENAAKYSPATAPIRVSCGPGEGGVVIRIEDRGVGFSSADLPRLFGRFFQAHRPRVQRSGLGLGLHITRGLVEAQGGRIAVDSQLGQGSTFRLWFPVAGDPAGAGGQR